MNDKLILYSQKFMVRTEEGERTLFAKTVDVIDPRKNAESCRRAVHNEVDRFLNLAIDETLLLSQSLLLPRELHISELERLVEYLKPRQESIEIMKLENDSRTTLVITINNA